MPNLWFRFYSEFADDPKVQMMSEPMQRRLTMLFCSNCKGETLHETELAFHWRVSLQDVAETKAVFVEKGFIDGDWNLTNWDKRQYISDSSTERVNRFRERKKRSETFQKRPEPVAVTVPDTEQNRYRTDTEQKTPYIPTAKEQSQMVAKRLQAETSLKSGELYPLLASVALQELETGLVEAQVFGAMADAWRDYSAQRPAEFAWGATKFFGEGYWKRPATWPGGKNGTSKRDESDPYSVVQRIIARQSGNPEPSGIPRGHEASET